MKRPTRDFYRATLRRHWGNFLWMSLSQSCIIDWYLCWWPSVTFRGHSNVSTFNNYWNYPLSIWTVFY